MTLLYVFLLLLASTAAVSAAPPPDTAPASVPSTIAEPASQAAEAPATQASTQPATLPATQASSQPSTLPSKQAATLPAALPRLSSAPKAPAAPVAAAAPSPRRMGDEYAVLLNRSIFLKGRQVTNPNAGGRGSAAAGVTAGTAPPTTAPDVVRPEGHMVFNGVTLVGNEPFAFIEDTTAAKVTKLRLGERIADGKISAITLDSIDYESNGKITHVNIGQNLNGVQGPSPSTRPAADASAGGPPPPGGGPSPAADDLLARMRARRQQELGGK